MGAPVAAVRDPRRKSFARALMSSLATLGLL